MDKKNEWLNVPDDYFYEYLKGTIDSANKISENRETEEYRRWRIWRLKKKNT